MGFSLLTLLPGEVGGSETYARGLLGAYCEGHGPERATVLVTDRLRRGLGIPGSGPVSVRAVPMFRYPRGTARRAFAMGAGLLAGERLCRAALADLDVLHHPLTVPLPRSRLPSVVTYHDAQHLEHPSSSPRP